jgi:uncharacterized membrane protein YagU involved in acid resistance
MVTRCSLVQPVVKVLYKIVWHQYLLFNLAQLTRRKYITNFRFSIVTASIFVALAIVYLIINCFKPIGSRGLLS